MLKINLLPPYIHQRKQVKIAAGIVTVLIAAEVFALVSAKAGPMKLAEEQKAEKAKKEAWRDKLNQISGQASKAMGEEQALKPKQEFIKSLLAYNTAYPELYKDTAGYTYKEVMFLNLESTANQLKFT